MAFRFTGFADEASPQLDQQIAVIKAAGWNGIELRGVNGTNVGALTDDAWQATLAAIRAAGLGVVGFGGQIANWSRRIDGDFQRDRDELERSAPRMKEAGTRLIRIMSYPNRKIDPLADADWKAAVVKRLRELARLAEDVDVILGHENCSGYGGVGPEQFLELVEAVDSPAFKLILDTGNNSFHDNDREATWRYYEACRDHIVHVHIKSAKPGPDGRLVTSYPDEDPIQERVLADLAARGYDGWISIEPHLAAVVHEGKQPDGQEPRRIWLEYARRIERLVAGLPVRQSVQ